MTHIEDDTAPAYGNKGDTEYGATTKLDTGGKINIVLGIKFPQELSDPSATALDLFIAAKLNELQEEFDRFLGESNIIDEVLES